MDKLIVHEYNCIAEYINVLV